MPTRESEGPDKCLQGGARCREFHDMPDSDLGGDRQCCCCNPCTHIRPYRAAGQIRCCRCVPRMMYLRFTPESPYTEEGECCREFIVPLVHNPRGACDPYTNDDLVSGYSGNLFDVFVYVNLGRVGPANQTIPGLGYGYRKCGWHIIAKRNSATIFERLYYIGKRSFDYSDYDDYEYEDPYDTITCDGLPNLLLATGLPLYHDCLYDVQLEQFEMVRVPFQQTVRGFIEADTQQLIHLCGECETDSYGNAIIPSCLLVDGETYTQDGSENGKPRFVNADRRVAWDGQQWTLLENLGYGYDDSVLAAGPETDCPIGLWQWVTDDEGGYQYEGNEEESCFCVSDCAATDLAQCGCCATVCSRICVKGPRHADDPMTPLEFRTFSWFENWESGVLIGRGWKYDNPDTELTEYVYLEQDYPSVLVDGERWYRADGPFSFGAWSAGYKQYPYWRGEVGGQEAYLYTGGDLSGWKIMVGGNEVSTGPTDISVPYSPYGTYTGLETHVVTPWDGAADNRCRLRPRFEQDEEDEQYGPKIIDTENGCATHLFETITTGNPSRFIEIRCGFCQCWRFHCGYCRCVPKQLCVTYWYDGTAYDGNILTWDNDIKGWKNDDCPLSLLLVRNGEDKYDANYDANDCLIIPSMSGYSWPEGQSHWRWDCGQEAVTKRFDWETWAIQYSYIDGINNLFITARSLTVDCGLTPCREGEPPTPCAEACGSHPAKLYATLTMHPMGDGGEAPPRPPYVLPTVELTLVSSISTIGGDFATAEFDCGYVGYLPSVSYGAVQCCAFLLFLSGISLTVYQVNPQYSCVDWNSSQSFDLSTPIYPDYDGIECDPYYARGASSTGLIIHQHCLHPEYDGTMGEIGSTSVEITE